MPVEIRELHITTVVTDAPSATGNTPAPTAAATTKIDTDAIVAACVEQVLQILNEKNER